MIINYPKKREKKLNDKISNSCDNRIELQNEIGKGKFFNSSEELKRVKINDSDCNEESWDFSGNRFLGDN